MTNNTIDFTSVIDLSHIEERETLEALFLLTADDIYSAMKCGRIYINGKMYETPSNISNYLNKWLIEDSFDVKLLINLKLTSVKQYEKQNG